MLNFKKIHQVQAPLLCGGGSLQQPAGLPCAWFKYFNI